MDMRGHLRTFAASCIAALLGAALPDRAAAASDITNSPGRPAAVVKRPPPGLSADSAAVAEADSLDNLRARLAGKLGADPKAARSRDQPTLVRIVNRADATDGGAQPAAAVNGTVGRSVPRVRAPADAPAQGPAARLAKAQRAHAATAADGVGHAPHWGYAGDGAPQHWGQLRPEFETCASGNRQSPIDIRDGLKLDLEPIRFSYQPSAVRVTDDGQTVQVDVAAGNAIDVMGRSFELQQFHFHRPSEERIDGRQFDMVVHLVHQDVDGRLAIVAVLLSRGAAQPLIQTIWNNLPLEKGLQQPVREPLDLNALLPVGRDYYTYMGSLTTPPCTEGVLWMVMKTPVGISDQQIDIFSRLYPMNARPLQAAAGRRIKQSN